MRTTLTIDDDLAIELERLRKQRDTSFRDVVNEALRSGLKELGAKAARHKRFRIKPFSLGRARISIDNIAEALAFAEGEDHK